MANGCMSLRDDKIVATQEDYSFASAPRAKAYVSVSGNRETIRANPFSVWHRDASPYSVNIALYTLDNSFSVVVLRSAKLMIDGKDCTPESWKKSARFSFEKASSSMEYEFTQRDPSVKTVLVAYCDLGINRVLPFESNNRISISCDLELEGENNSHKQLRLDAFLKPITSKEIMSWFRCIRLILGGE
jgi:hypothetical protein